MLIKGLQLGRDPKRLIGGPLETEIRGKQARQTKYQMANAKLHPARLFGRWLSGNLGAVQHDEDGFDPNNFIIDTVLTDEPNGGLFDIRF